MASAILGRWGKSLAVRLPAEIAEVVGLREGQKLEILQRDREIIIRPAPATALDRLFAGKSAEEWRDLYRDLDPWGADLGREIVDE